ncbi:MAG: nuclear transport factor 2 family protein [Lysobacterales bacterium]
MAALVGCSRAPAEERLRGAMTGLQAAIEAREVGEAMEYVGEDFIGTGSLDREGARNLLRLMVLRHQTLGLSLGPAEIELFEGRASVRFTAVATGGQGALLPQSARVWNVETAWRDDGDEWRLISAQWK